MVLLTLLIAVHSCDPGDGDVVSELLKLEAEELIPAMAGPERTALARYLGPAPQNLRAEAVATLARRELLNPAMIAVNTESRRQFRALKRELRAVGFKRVRRITSRTQRLVQNADIILDLDGKGWAASQTLFEYRQGYAEFTARALFPSLSSKGLQAPAVRCSAKSLHGRRAVAEARADAATLSLHMILFAIANELKIDPQLTEALRPRRRVGGGRSAPPFSDLPFGGRNAQLLSSRRNQARALRHVVTAVVREVPRSLATSSIVKPTK
ncbi:MAG: hypothetical protein AAFU77_07185 [Myxococcota bacterium]